MNLLHHWLCRSAGWKRNVRKNLLPWAMEEVQLGARVLEIGPGFGVTTELLRGLVEQLTCIEVDSRLAQRLERKMSGRNVAVVRGDATSMSFADDEFDSVVCFTMLHHLPSAQLQDRVLTEAHRVLRPGGVFAGSDSLGSWRMRMLHVFDTMVLVDPGTFGERLRLAGFVDVHVGVGAPGLRFRGRKPISAETCARDSSIDTRFVLNESAMRPN